MLRNFICGWMISARFFYTNQSKKTRARENSQYKAQVDKNEEVYKPINDGVFIPPATQ